MILTALSVFILLYTGNALTRSIGVPPPVVPKEQQAKGADLHPKFVPVFRVALIFIKALVFSVLGAEVLAVLISSISLNAATTANIKQLFPHRCLALPIKDKIYPNSYISPVALLGCLMYIAGSRLRALGQRTLGPLFTWEVTIQPTHKLITSGPYAYVRHPSYAGTLVMVLGEIIFVRSRGTFLSECLSTAYPRFTFYGGWLVFSGMSFGLSSMVRRTWKEDAILHQEFGKEWEDWASKVKYRLFPGIF